jgi:hypothetical protein
MGTSLVEVSVAGAATILGDVGGSGQCTFDIGFGYISIRSGDQLYYWDGTTLTHVTDTDLGPVIDSMWIDGYNMTTDGENIIVTELNDKTSVLPLKYGSAEEDPDMVTGLIKARDEAYALGNIRSRCSRMSAAAGFRSRLSKAPQFQWDASGRPPSVSMATASRSSARHGTRRLASTLPVRVQRPGSALGRSMTNWRRSLILPTSSSKTALRGPNGGCSSTFPARPSFS